jgi:YesN/AraC family two-component response regulator
LILSIRLNTWASIVRSAGIRGMNEESCTTSIAGFMFLCTAHTDEAIERTMVTRLIKILIVDDDDIQRTLLRHTLEKNFSCDILEAKNGLEGLRAIERTRPDMIFLDIWMPVMNGPQMVERLKQMHHTFSIPVIILSGIGDKEMIARIISLGVSDYLLKPLHNEQVIDRFTKIANSIQLTAHNLA